MTMNLWCMSRHLPPKFLLERLGQVLFQCGRAG